MDEFEIKQQGFDQNELLAVVGIHMNEIGRGFLSSLGEKPLSLMFQYASESPYGVLLVAKESATGNASGFVLGATHTGKLYREFLLKKGLRGLLLIGPSLFSWKRIRKALETLFYPSKNELRGLPKAELLAVAIHRSHHGGGLAQKLMEGFKTAMKARGAESFRVFTDAGNLRAQRFFEKAGAQWIGRMEVHRGQEAVLYVYGRTD